MFCFFEKNEKKGQENIISKSRLKFPLAGCEKKKWQRMQKGSFIRVDRTTAEAWAPSTP